MPRRTVLLAASLFLALLLALAAACGGGGDDDDAPETPATNGDAATAVPEETLDNGTVVLDIRAQDLTTQSGVVSFVVGSNGVPEPDRIIYVDLTGDGLDEAILPISSGGEGGDIGIFVFGFVDGELQQLRRILPLAGSLTAEVEGNVIVITEPVFAEGDPLCCPSGTSVTEYAWDGEGLNVVEEPIEE